MPSSNPRYASWPKRESRRRAIRASQLPCALCGRPIDYSIPHFYVGFDGKRHVHPASFVVDEIEPQCLGGSVSSADNTQPAHAACNAVRGKHSMAWVRGEGRKAIMAALPRAMKKLSRQLDNRPVRATRGW